MQARPARERRWRSVGFCASIRVRAISSRKSGMPSLRFTISSTTRSGSKSESASESIIFSHSRLVMRFNISVVT